MNEIEKAINDLDDLKNCDSISRSHFKDVPGKHLELAITALTEKLNSGWISVEDALPTIPIEKINDGYNRIAVLVISKNQDMAIIRWYDIEDKLFYDDFGFFGDVDEGVITWQPLPQKYKEEK